MGHVLYKLHASVPEEGSQSRAIADSVEQKWRRADPEEARSEDPNAQPTGPSQTRGVRVSQPPLSWRRVLSILWFPGLFAVVLPLVLLVAIQLRRDKLPIAAGPHDPLASGVGGTAVFLLVLPLMMAGVITAVVSARRPAWGIGRRVVLVAGVGAAASLTTYLSAVGLHLVPGEPLLLAGAFLITQLTSAPILASTDDAHAVGATSTRRRLSPFE